MKHSIAYFVSLLLAILLLLQCKKNVELSHQSESNARSLMDSVTLYKNALGGKTASIAALKGEKKTIETLMLQKDAELKALAKEFSKLKFISKLESKVKIDTIAIPFNAPIAVCDSSGTFNRTGSFVTKWYNLNYKVTNDSLTLSSVNMDTETTIITGFKRKWLLGKETLYTDVTHNNPYISVSNIKSAEIIVPEPWYKKWYVWLGVGIIGGIAIK